MNLVGDAEDPDLVAPPVELLHGGVVGVLVADVEGAADGATVGVKEVLGEDLLVDGQVVDVHGAVEGQGDHLGHLGNLELTGDLGSVG